METFPDDRWNHFYEKGSLENVVDLDESITIETTDGPYLLAYYHKNFWYVKHELIAFILSKKMKCSNDTALLFWLIYRDKIIL